jgi:hypothetical protein
MEDQISLLKEKDRSEEESLLKINQSFFTKTVEYSSMDQIQKVNIFLVYSLEKGGNKRETQK